MEVSTAQVIAAFVAVISAVLYLWKLQVSQHAETETQLKECQKSHDEATQKLFELNGRMSHLEGEHEGIKSLAASVIQEIQNLQI